MLTEKETMPQPPTSYNQTEYAPSITPFRRVTLEISLKPFYDTTPQTREKVCRKLFTQWLPLCMDTDIISVMLWIGDGSELVTYKGNFDDTFEWGKWLGCVSSIVLKEDNEEEVANELEEDDQGLGLHGKDDDPNGIGLHRRAYLYRDNPPEFTYRWLRELIRDLKRIGTEITGKPVQVGDTFDPGPELAFSDFKYNQHPEILKSVEFLGSHFVYCGTKLHADNIHYAAFPNGIPEGLHFGTFLGQQTSVFFKDMGFDFLWLSNGFGFGSETLSFHGKLFDGKTFTPERTTEFESTVFEFWEKFRAEAPDIQLRTRGTNLTTGVDLASDAVPLNKIYKQIAEVEPPVNSPWAAMDGDFGLEFAGWMSHIAEIPDNTYPFRLYINDPWWMNSPWLDRYERSPHDIYMPLSICRINSNGKTHSPDTINFLTTDNSIGQLPQQVAADVTSHIMHSRENQPDQPGPVVWIYPWDEYHEMTFSEHPEIQEVYFGDWYIRGIINNGFPLNTVISSNNFTAITKTTDQWTGNILLLSTSSAPAVQNTVLEHVAAGGKAIFYGPINEKSKRLAAILNLKKDTGIEGDCKIKLSGNLNFSTNEQPDTIHHPATFSGGELQHYCEPDNFTEEIAKAIQGNETRSLAIIKESPEWNGGQLAWLRGGMSCNEKIINQFLPAMLPKDKFFYIEKLAVIMLHKLGIQIQHHSYSNKDKEPLITISRSKNAFIFSGYNPDDAEISFKLPLGAPIFTSRYTTIKNKMAQIHTPTGWHHECRVFVEQEDDTRIRCRELPVIMAGYKRRLLLTGLQDTIVRFLPVDGEIDKIEFLLNPKSPYIVGNFIKPTKIDSIYGTYFETNKISGRMLISW